MIQTINIRHYRDNRWSVSHFDIDNGPDHLRNLTWNRAWKYLAEKGMGGVHIERVLRASMKPENTQDGVYQLQLEV